MAIAALSRAVARDGSPVTVALDDAHLGLVAHPGSRRCQAENIRHWMPAGNAKSRLTLILVSAKGRNAGLPGSVIQELVDTAPYLARQRTFAGKTIKEVCQRSDIARLIINLLKKADTPITHMEISDCLDRRGRAKVFTPEVEYCLRHTLADVVEYKDGRYDLWEVLKPSVKPRKSFTGKERAL